jgi:dTDP-glucose 4,6-dehydratase
MKNKNKTIKLGNLKPTRDFNYVEDVCHGFELALKAKNIFGETINLGSGYEISMKDIALLISSLMDSKINIKKITERMRPNKSEVMRLCASNVKAKKLLKWKPKFSGKNGLKKGLIKTIEWFQENETFNKDATDSYVI